MKKRYLFILMTIAILIPNNYALAVSGGISVDAVERWKEATKAQGLRTYDELESSYSAGQYKVGIDISAGEYVLFASKGIGYFCVSSDSNADDILFNDNFEYNSIITVNEGEYLDLERCYAVSMAENPDVDISATGLFKVGVHIPAGEYKLNADSGSMGYYCIYESSIQQNIISNDNFEGSRYVTVNDGQYLKLVRCSFDSVPEMVYEDSSIIMKVQETLGEKGYDCGNADGVIGEKTIDAIKKFQSENNMECTGKITDELLVALEVE